MKEPKFGFINKLGGREAVCEYMLKKGYPIKSGDFTIRNWESRKRIPAEAKLVIMEIAAEKKVLLSKDDFEYGKEKKDG